MYTWFACSLHCLLSVGWFVGVCPLLPHLFTPLIALFVMIYYDQPRVYRTNSLAVARGACFVPSRLELAMVAVLQCMFEAPACDSCLLVFCFPENLWGVLCFFFSLLTRTILAFTDLERTRSASMRQPCLITTVRLTFIA